MDERLLGRIGFRLQCFCAAYPFSRYIIIVLWHAARAHWPHMWSAFWQWLIA